MSKIYRYYEDMISELAEKTCYEFDFLLDRFNEVMEEDGDVACFVDITLEQDW